MVYNAFILIAEDTIKDLRTKIANFDPNDHNYEYIQSLSFSLKTLDILGNQRFWIVAGYSGIMTRGVDGHTKTMKSTVGGHMAMLLGLKGTCKTCIKVFSNSKSYAALQLISSDHIISQIIHIPTFPDLTRKVQQGFLRWVERWKAFMRLSMIHVADSSTSAN
jgi:hypothetical protein